LLYLPSREAQGKGRRKLQSSTISIYRDISANFIPRERGEKKLSFATLPIIAIYSSSRYIVI
jgi:hypothetical protein